MVACPANKLKSSGTAGIVIKFGSCVGSLGAEPSVASLVPALAVFIDVTGTALLENPWQPSATVRRPTMRMVDRYRQTHALDRGWLRCGAWG